MHCRHLLQLPIMDGLAEIVLHDGQSDNDITKVHIIHLGRDAAGDSNHKLEPD